MECRLLSLQDWAQERRLAMGRVSTTENMSDLLTKFLTKAALADAMQRLGVGEPGAGGELAAGLSGAATLWAGHLAKT